MQVNRKTVDGKDEEYRKKDLAEAKNEDKIVSN